MISFDKIAFDGDFGSFVESARKASTFLDYAHPASFQEAMDGLYSLEGFERYCDDAARSWRGRMQRALFHRFFWRQMLVNQALALRLRLIQGISDPRKPLLLYIVPHDATQALMGGTARNHEMARYLTQWFRVKMIAVVGPSKDPQVIPVGPDFEILAFPQARSSLINSVTKRTRGSLAKAFVAFMDSVDRASFLLPYLHEIAPQTSAVLLSSPFTYPAVKQVLSGIPIVYETMDVTADYINMVSGGEGAESVQKIVEVERVLIHDARMIIGVSPRDIETMKMQFDVPDNKFLLIPNGVNVAQRFCSVPSLSREMRRAFGPDRPVVLFVGAPMEANIEAAVYIRDELAPAFPRALFVVMGIHKRELPPVCRKQGPFSGNLIFTGPLPDNSRLKEAIFLLTEVAIAPMIHGTGSSLKVPDYLAHGKLLVSTEIGARGHDALHSHIWLAPRAEFKAVLGDLLDRLESNPAAFDEHARSAREKVRELLDWSVACAPLATALQQIMRFRTKESMS